MVRSAEGWKFTHRLRLRPLSLRDPDAFPVDDVNAVVLRNAGMTGESFVRRKFERTERLPYTLSAGPA